ncbi:MAG: hypothetical protein IJG49_04910 [Erysipelotrichaceae bacterium]|nr:hypothetical protein [Erysipelotrichaceae bacterium]MBQ6629676.1 hypothetical protein [Methanobrevibacter sp.]
MESKHERFIRLGQARTNRIIEQINLIGNLANRGNYEYSDEEVNKMFKAIEDELKEVKNKFKKTKDREINSKFTF